MSVFFYKIKFLICFLLLSDCLSFSAFALDWLEANVKVGAQNNSNPGLINSVLGVKTNESFVHIDPHLFLKSKLGELSFDFLTEARIFVGKLLVTRTLPEFAEKISLASEFSGLDYQAHILVQQKNETDWDLFLLDLRTQVISLEQNLKSTSANNSYFWQFDAKLKNKDYQYNKINIYNYLQGVMAAHAFFKVTEQQTFQLGALWNSRVYLSNQSSHLINLAYPTVLLGLNSQLTRGNEIKFVGGYNFLSPLGKSNNNINPFIFSIELSTSELTQNRSFYAKLNFAPDYHHLDLMSQVLEILVGMNSIYFDRFQFDLMGKIKQQQMPNRMHGLDTLMGGQMNLKYFINRFFQLGIFLTLQNVFSSIERNNTTVSAPNFIDEYPYILSSQGFNLTGNAYAQLAF